MPSVLLIEEQHVVVQDEGCLIEAFLHVEKAGGNGSIGFYEHLQVDSACVFGFARTERVRHSRELAFHSHSLKQSRSFRKDGSCFELLDLSELLFQFQKPFPAVSLGAGFYFERH